METESSCGFVPEIREGSDGGGSLGLKLQRTESFPYKKMMTMHHHRPFDSGDVGPTFGNVSTEGNRSRSDIYDVFGGGSGSGSAVVRTLQPFNISAFKSPGGMAASLRFPFTSAQWQELERQALIYKYMMNSVPVPSDLLISINRNLADTAVASHSTLGRGTCLNLRFSNNTDPEPGRCRRTDGKKWRCSRDVAPDQKYCERHMHRGRPRSRKHVEVQAEINSNSSINSSSSSINTHSVPPTTLAANTSSSSSHYLGAVRPYHQPSGFVAKPDFKVPSFETMASASSYKDSSRSMEWMMKGETVPMATSNQQWQQFMHSKANLNTNAPVFQQHYQESLNLNSYTDFGPGGDDTETHQQSDQCCIFLNHELASLEEPLSSDQRQTPRRFIDAWSNTGENPTETSKSSVSENSKLSLSNLTLSMSGGNGIGDEMSQIQMGLGVIDSERDNGGAVKSQPLSWMTPVSWMPSPPGGPLGEVLQSSTNASSSHCPRATNKRSSGADGLNLTSDGWNRGGDTSSPQATTISSPSGVLQKTLASLSDSSGNSSPTLAAAAAKSEIALQWMNQNKLPSS